MRKNRFLLVVLVMSLVGSVSLAWANPMFKSAKQGVAASETGRYIVVLDDAPLAMYNGGVAGLASTNPQKTGAAKLDVTSQAARAYNAYLLGKQDAVLAAIGTSLKRSPKVDFHYTVVLNGFAAQLTREEANLTAGLDGVSFVQPEYLDKINTDAGPQWIGADTIWNGAPGYAAAMGEGIIVGIIDTGINPLNPSFLDPGPVDAYDYTNPLGKYVGVCDTANTVYDSTFPCNNKLIGAWDFTPEVTGNPVGPTDVNGHGSHTASTTAGNQVNAQVTASTAALNRTISGVAPHANIIAYRGCYPDAVGGGCPTSATLAATEQAVKDGVDVINYSIGGNSRDPWTDANALAFLSARNSGVFVAVGAGNSGPAASTLGGSPANAPWVMSVAASTHNRALLNTLNSLTSNGPALADINGQGMAGSLARTSIVFAGDFPNPNTPATEAASLCCTGYPAGTFTGQIVVCDRGGACGRAQKSVNVQAGGAGGFILANDQASATTLIADSFALPGAAISYQDGVDLKAWIAAYANTMAALSGVTADLNTAWADTMASFSSRGPDATSPDVIKPDVAAPGMNIIAANGTGGAISWGVMSGTSMATPHAAGAAALVRQLHPKWTPAEVQSALMMTGYQTNMKKEDLTMAADAFDMGAGRVQAAQAIQSGLIMNETYSNYNAADPSSQGDPATLNIPSLAQDKTVVSYSWTRTVENSTSLDITWTVNTTSSSSQLSLSVSPNLFTLAAGATQEITVTANVATAAAGQWLFGQVDFTAGDQTALHWPVAVQPATTNLESEYSFSSVYRTGTVTIKNIQSSTKIIDFTANVFGMTPATEYSGEIYQVKEWWDEDALYVVKKVLTAGNARLVAELLETTSPGMNLYILDKTNDIWVCNTSGAGSEKYCNIDSPAAGEYWIYLQNWMATDPTGVSADTFTLGVAVVPGSASTNASVSVTQATTAEKGAGREASIAAGTPFNMNLAINLTGQSLHWYGGFTAGTDANNPANIGRTNIDIVHNNQTPNTGGGGGSDDGGGGCFINVTK